MKVIKLMPRYNIKFLILFFVITALLRRSYCGAKSTVKDFQRDVLDEHNKYRSTHGANSLTLDENLSKNATLEAKKAAKMGNFDMISPGQSVFVSCATFKREVSGQEVTDAWYGEVCNPDFTFNNPDNEKARGFTQLVWKDTNRLGVGRATGTNDNKEICVYIVGVYRPPGNLVGFFNENVEQGTFDKEAFCNDDTDADSTSEDQNLDDSDDSQSKQERKENSLEYANENSELDSDIKETNSITNDPQSEKDHDSEIEENKEESQTQQPPVQEKEPQQYNKKHLSSKKHVTHNEEDLSSPKQSHKKNKKATK